MVTIFSKILEDNGGDLIQSYIELGTAFPLIACNEIEKDIKSGFYNHSKALDILVEFNRNRIKSGKEIYASFPLKKLLNITHYKFKKLL